MAPGGNMFAVRSDRAIQIDGQNVKEHDYHACHPRLLNAIAGLGLPFDDVAYDFYANFGIDRP